MHNRYDDSTIQYKTNL